jgi:hypothetical protein
MSDASTLGDAVRVSIRPQWRSMVGALVRELLPFHREGRNQHWSELVRPFIEHERRAGTPEAVIARTVDALATLVANELIRLENENLAPARGCSGIADRRGEGTNK